MKSPLSLPNGLRGHFRNKLRTRPWNVTKFQGAFICQKLLLWVKMTKQSHEKGDNFQRETTETAVLDLVPAGWTFLKSRDCLCPNLITFFISRRRYRTSLEVLVRVHTLRIISLLIKHWLKYEINGIFLVFMNISLD